MVCTVSFAKVALLLLLLLMHALGYLPLARAQEQ